MADATRRAELRRRLFREPSTPTPTVARGLVSQGSRTTLALGRREPRSMDELIRAAAAESYAAARSRWVPI